MSRKQIHTSGNRKNGYKNTINGKQIGKTYKTKKEAVNNGKNESKKIEGEHIIHSQDGKFQYSNSYGNDPCPPKDKK